MSHWRTARDQTAPEGAALISLSNGRGYTIVDASDYAWASKIRWHLSIKKSRAGAGYACGYSDGERVKLHRMILNAKPGEIGDHINGDTLDNRRANLRICTHTDNVRNSDRGGRLHGFKGISEFTEVVYVTRYRAYFTVDDKPIYGPVRHTPQEAATDYDRLAIEHHGPFAFTNFAGPGEDRRRTLLPSPALTSEGGS